MPEEHLSLRKQGALAHLVIDRPEVRNAMSLSMWRALPKLVESAVDDREIKVLIIQGANEEAFAAGADIGEIADHRRSESLAAEFMDAVHGAEAAIAGCGKPVIAMIRGYCVGGGIELALACDLRFASTRSEFAVPPAKLGALYSLYSTKRLVDLIGVGKARDLLFSSRSFDTAEALAMGLVERAWTPERIVPETIAYAETLCRRSQFSIHGTKRIVAEILRGAHEEGEVIRRLRVEGFLGEDLAEGTRAFLEKRKPSFTWLPRRQSESAKANTPKA